MNGAIPVWIVLVTMISVVVIMGIIRVITAIQSSIQQISVSIDRAVVSNEKLATHLDAVLAALISLSATVHKLQETFVPASEEMRANMVGVPKLLEAVARVGQAQLEFTQVERERVRNPFGRTNAPAAPRDTVQANLEFEIQQMQRAEGISREEALMRLNPANSQSVWGGGDGLFSGWNNR